KKKKELLIKISPVILVSPDFCLIKSLVRIANSTPAFMTYQDPISKKNFKGLGMYINGRVLLGLISNTNQLRTFFFFFDTGSCCLAQAGLEVLGSSDPPILASQVAGTTRAYQCAQFPL
uniref:Uncharacterized protein n=1 Tax=Sciurus vulgaris TaxID=55149 RepID=A0A8D2B4J0_SCIVU